MADVSQLEGSILPVDEEAPPSGPRRRPRLVVVLALLLTVVATSVGLLAARLYQGEQLDARQSAARDAVALYTAALDRHDLTAVHAVSLDQASFAEAEDLRWPMLGPLERSDRDRLFTQLFAAGLRLRSTGPAQVVGEGPYRIVVRQTVHYVAAGITIDEDGMSLFTVVDRPDGPQVSDHIWWRLPRAPKPSMVWVR
jgi:hypothetical protein